MLRALDAAIIEAGETVTSVGDRSQWFTQQQLSNWINGKASMSAVRFVEVCREIGADPAKVFARGVELAGEAGLLRPQLRVVSDPPGNVDLLAAGRSNQAEMETHEQD